MIIVLIYSLTQYAIAAKCAIKNFHYNFRMMSAFGNTQHSSYFVLNVISGMASTPTTDDSSEKDSSVLKGIGECCSSDS
jgi:hypothetical protein